ncbi:methylated-DNA--[protein]-cysteine S-methyltransferase [Rurimicrobium arvi]|uniref:Methylated-DNA--[protein]-cysteine S-methyltransferase n=1 Tax=Rurimicrobium arvi TaxID=2049916 RepID=A0ABP8MS16_9BACT
MNDHSATEHYKRIAEAIRFMLLHQQQQPDLAAVAAAAHYSPFHFQKVFSEYTGVSPKKFQRYLSLNHAKNLLDQQSSLENAAWESGLSGTSRLHDLFVSLEAMTPAEYRNKGADLLIDYSFGTSLFGNVLVASTGKGVCHLAFEDNNEKALAELHAKFPDARFNHQQQPMHTRALHILQHPADSPGTPLKLHLKGTPFQLKVWEALLKIPQGQLCSYRHIAAYTGDAQASRAAGTAIGANPVAFLIPCHRVIRGSGVLGGYRWGLDRKAAILAWETALSGAGSEDEL